MPDPIDDGFPVGAVAAFGGELSGNPNWLLCDGSAYSTTTYDALYALIGFTFGGSGANFQVPDLRGRFVRGSSTTLAPFGQPQDWGTAQPTNPFLATVPNLPTGFVGVSGETSSGAGPVGSDTRNTCTDGGGDGDTRPINVYVNFYIKAKQA